MTKRVNLIRPLVEQLHPYVPGEQPKIEGLIKLNTNENPYPPSPKVLDAVRAATDARLRLYPNPTAQALCERLADVHGCQPENIIIGNGSDELLTLAVRAFVEPISAIRGSNSSSATVQFFDPSYSLYPVLAEIHGSATNAVPLAKDFRLPTPAQLEARGQWRFDAALTLITTPNAPSGRGFPTCELKALCEYQNGVTILDEAYVDFAEENALSLALQFPHVLVARTFSKSYSLCFQRIGYFVGSALLIRALHKVRDSYNVNGLGQVAALATLDDLPYYQKNFRKIIASRTKLTSELTSMGFTVFPSQANFILAKPPGPSAEIWLKMLREEKILVRWFNKPKIKQYLRITIGSNNEVAALLKAVHSSLVSNSGSSELKEP